MKESTSIRNASEAARNLEQKTYLAKQQGAMAVWRMNTLLFDAMCAGEVQIDGNLCSWRGCLVEDATLAVMAGNAQSLWAEYPDARPSSCEELLQPKKRRLSPETKEKISNSTRIRHARVRQEASQIWYQELTFQLKLEGIAAPLDITYTPGPDDLELRIVGDLNLDKRLVVKVPRDQMTDLLAKHNTPQDWARDEADRGLRRSVRSHLAHASRVAKRQVISDTSAETV